MASDLPNLISTLVAVEVGAALNNGHVIGEAFRRSSITCPNCNYLQNSTEYERLLAERITLHIKLHHLLKKMEGRWRSRMPIDYPPKPALLQDYKQVYTQLYLIKTQMRKIHPCSTCRKRFNPTRRVKYCLFNLPRKQEFIYG